MRTINMNVRYFINRVKYHYTSVFVKSNDLKVSSEWLKLILGGASVIKRKTVILVTGISHSYKTSFLLDMLVHLLLCNRLPFWRKHKTPTFLFFTTEESATELFNRVTASCPSTSEYMKSCVTIVQLDPHRDVTSHIKAMILQKITDSKLDVAGVFIDNVRTLKNHSHFLETLRDMAKSYNFTLFMSDSLSASSYRRKQDSPAWLSEMSNEELTQLMPFRFMDQLCDVKIFVDRIVSKTKKSLVVRNKADKSRLVTIPLIAYGDIFNP